MLWGSCRIPIVVFKNQVLDQTAETNALSRLRTANYGMAGMELEDVLEFDESHQLPIVLRADFPTRTIRAPHSVAEDLRNRLKKTYAQFSVITIDEQELQVSSDIFDLTQNLRDGSTPNKPR